MKFKLTLVLVALLIVTNIFAQVEDKTSSELSIASTENTFKTYGKVDLSFSGLGLSLETPISNVIMLEVAAGAGAGYRVDEDFRYRMYFDSPSIYGSVHGKYYYNQALRTERGRSVNFNAGNFFGVKAKYTTPNLVGETKTWHTMIAAFHWGMQRKMGRHFMYQLTVGIGGAIDLDDKTTTHMTLFPDFNFRVSYVLPFGN